MKICRVTGTVVAPVKDAHLAHNKLLICQPLDLDGEPRGADFIALDRAQAAPGDRVLVCGEGGSARIVFNDEEIPLRNFVVAIVDDIEVHDPADLEPADTWS